MPNGDKQFPAKPIPGNSPDAEGLGRIVAALNAMERPKRIGPYRILETLGEGGMGVVYLAEQEKPLRRRVALKIIKLGMDTKKVVARFEAEREALALMNHPNVAKVFDAGSTEEGRPFFVMEHVPGLPITEYCDRNRLSTEDRLRLFMDVCHAVQHAHQKGIIHRDIKPSNVLVAVQDDKPIAKVIDFGVAKAVQQRLTQLTVFTEQGQLIGTPGYMSPEQADFTALDIDTRTDIYSLGVLLYELLVGALPFDTRFLLAAGWLEVQRIIREVDPPRPSTRLSAMKMSEQGKAAAPYIRDAGIASPQHADRERVDSPIATQSIIPSTRLTAQKIPVASQEDPITAVAHRRRTQPATLLRILRGDLDWVVMKCLEKDRTHRYDTANALAQDIEHFLNNEPVVAGQPSVGYRFRKFVRRNRTQVTLASAILLGICCTLIGTLVMYSRAEVARSMAEAALASEAEQRGRAERSLNEAQEARAEAVKARNRANKESTLAQERLDSILAITRFLAQRGAANWLPNDESPPRKWTTIVLHHTATPNGSIELFNTYHRRSIGEEIGYHFVIAADPLSGDGLVAPTSRWLQQKHGMHCGTPSQYFNDYGIGIAIIGDFDQSPPPELQMESTKAVLLWLMRTYDIPPDRVLMHKDARGRESAIRRSLGDDAALSSSDEPETSTPCPGSAFPMQELQQYLESHYKKQ